MQSTVKIVMYMPTHFSNLASLIYLIQTGN